MSFKKRFLFLSCKETAKCCDKAQYDEATFSEKVMIHLHIMMCKPCRSYTAKNIKLTDLLKKAKIKTCTKEEKEAWKNKIEKEITK